MKEVTYTLTKDNGIEYPARFKGQKVSYMLPETLDEFKAERVAPDADADKVILAAINGQGLSLTIQKSIKDFLDSDKVNGTRDADGKRIGEPLSVEEAITQATDHASTFRLGTPRATGEGTGRKNGKVAAAEAGRDAAVNAALTAYRAVPKNLRKQVRQALLDSKQVTAEQLDEIDAEK